MKWPFFRNRDGGAAERREPTFNAASPENPSTNLSNPDGWIVDAMGGGASFAGPLVSEQSAMRSTTVFRCVSLVSGLNATVPIGVYETTSQGRRDAGDHRYHYLLHDEPNDLMSAFTWVQLISVDLLLGGNHYSLIEYDNAARVVGFFPLVRTSVTPRREGDRNKYDVRTDKGLMTVDQADIIHVPGLGFDGLKGLSPIAFAGKQSIGLDLAMQEATARLHANGVRPTGMVEVSGNISPDAFKAMKAEFRQGYAGVANMGRPIFVDKDTKWTALQISPEDAQTLDSRRFQVTDICRLFGVPPHLVMETDKSTSWGTGIEQQSLSFLRFSIDPWLKAIEGELKRKLFSRSTFYAEFNRDALLAMDSKAQSEAFASGIQNAYYKPSEVRRWKNLPPVDGADQLYINSTMQPLAMAGQRRADQTPNAA